MRSSSILSVLCVCSELQQTTDLIDARGAEASAIQAGKRLLLHEADGRLMCHDPELADTVIEVDLRIACGICGEVPLIVVPAVALVNNADVVGLDESEILEGGAAGSDERLIALRELHGDAEGDQTELARLHPDIFSGTEIDPVGFSADIAQPFKLVVEVFDMDFLVHGIPPPVWVGFMG